MKDFFNYMNDNNIEIVKKYNKLYDELNNKLSDITKHLSRKFTNFLFEYNINTNDGFDISNNAIDIKIWFSNSDGLNIDIINFNIDRNLNLNTNIDRFAYDKVCVDLWNDELISYTENYIKENLL